jgi:hypothetical protein
MNRRHVRVARAAQAKVIAWLQSLDPKGLSPQDAARWYDLATKAERLALGQATERVHQEQSGETQVALRVVERIVPTRRDDPGARVPSDLLPAPHTALPLATGGAAATPADRLPAEIVDDGTGDPPSFDLPDEPPGRGGAGHVSQAHEGGPGR